MANVDLYGNDAQRLRGGYKTSLGRDASDDEVTGWMTGRYATGGTVDDWLKQIDSSHEAQQYRARTAPRTVGQPNPNVNTTLTPQPTAPAPTRPAFTPQTGFPQQNNQAGVYWDFNDENFQRQIAEYYWQHLGRTPGMQDFMGHLGNPGGLRGIEDTIRNSDEARAYAARRPAPPPGGSGTSGTQPGPQGGNFQNWFMTMAGNGPSSPEALGAMEAELARHGIRLQKDSFGVIRGRIYLPDGSAVDVVPPNGWGQPWTWIPRGSGGGGHAGGGGHGGGVGQGVGLPGSQYSDPHTKLLEEMMLARVNALQQGTDPGYQRLMQFMEQRFNELQGPGRTGAENEVIRTQALDPIENDRQAARKRITERMAAAGHTMESGVMQMALMEVDKAFDAERATTQNVFASDELNRREGRFQQAGDMAGAMYDIPQRRNREAIGYSGALADLGPQRLQLAMQAAGMGGSPYSMFNSLMQMAQMNQNSALLNQQNSSQLWGGLGEMAYEMWRAGRR